MQMAPENPIKIIVIFLVLGAVLAVVVLMRAKGGDTIKDRSRRNSKTSKTPSAPRNPYRATSIVFDGDSCDVVKAISGKCFLDVEGLAPRLPLPDCNLSTCNCKYARHEDRRESDDDRRLPAGLKSQLYDRGGDPNRRQKPRGRRVMEWA
jgi:hypothetical protein